MVVLWACGIELLAQIDDFQYRRSLGSVAQNWHRIDLPPQIFEKINTDLSDLRIVSFSSTGDTLIVPYVIMNWASATTEIEHRFDILNQTHHAGLYYYTFDLGSNHEVNRIFLKFENSNYDWQVQLEGSHTQKDWFSIVENYRILAIKNLDADYSFSTLVFPKVDYRYFRIRLNAHEKPRLINASVELNSMGNPQLNVYESSFKVKHHEKEKKSTIVIATHYTVPVSSIKLSFDNKFDFYRKASVSYLYDSVKVNDVFQKRYRHCATGIISSFEDPVFNFDPVFSKEFLITVENNDNIPVTPAAVSVSGPVYYLLARYTGTPNTSYLYYGNAMAKTPQYDIAKFNTIVPDSAAVLKVGEEELIMVKKPALPLIADKRWLWATLIAMMILLGWFSLKMLRKG
jgi:hypothetical protein